MAVKRRKRKAALILAAAVTGALVSGCAGSYEAVSVGTVLAAAQEDVSGQETADSQGLPSLSEKETELAMAPAPAFQMYRIRYILKEIRSGCARRLPRQTRPISTPFLITGLL